MKKLLAILLSTLMLLSCVGAFAEGMDTVRFVEDSPNFDIEMPLPEGATVGDKGSVDTYSYVVIENGTLASVVISVAPSDLYDGLSMNDLSDDDVEILKATAAEQYDDPVLTVDVTPSGNKYIHVCANSEYDIDSIFTLYMGYFVELTQFHDDFSTITDEDYAFMQQLLYNITFTPVEK